LHSGKKFLELVRKIISNYIEKTKINFKILIDNQKKISFENHSYVTIVSHNLQAWKGKSIDLVIFDNAAFIKELNSIYASIVPCLEYKKGQMIINSCSVYYSEFNILAQEIKSGINKHIHYEQIHWTKHPIFGKNKKLVKKSDAEYFIEETKYTNEWYRDVKRHISDDIDRINQELNCKLIIGRNQK
jgi:hypothetical protein